MKIYYNLYANPNGLDIDGGKLVIKAAKHTTIQPDETIKVPTEIWVKTDPDNIIQLYTHSFLTQKSAQIFPAVILIGSEETEKALEIPITNCGRTQLNIMAGNPLVFGMAFKLEEVELESFERNTRAVPQSRSAPQKKNPSSIKFDMQ